MNLLQVIKDRKRPYTLAEFEQAQRVRNFQASKQTEEPAVSESVAPVSVAGMGVNPKIEALKIKVAGMQRRVEERKRIS